MSEAPPQREEILAQRVDRGLKHLGTLHRRLERTNAALLVGGIFSSGLATLVTGITAAQGPVIGEGPPGWRLACATGAVFSFATTVSVGLSQRLKIGERLAETKECAGRLRSLEIALATGSRSWHDIAQEYEEVVKAYPDIVK